MLTVSDIPFPATTVAAGVVTLAINLDGTGQITNVQTLRDIPTVTDQAMLAFTATFPPYPANGNGAGAVVLDATINNKGSITQVTTVLDIPGLTAAAVAALQNWSFGAALYGNTSIALKVVVAMMFRNPTTALP